MTFLTKLREFRKKSRAIKYETNSLGDVLQSLQIETLRENTKPYKVQHTGNHVIYSTYCGSSRNKTFNPRKVESSIDHIFISNNENILRLAESAGWKPHHLNLPVYENLIYSALQAKIAKAIPHIFTFINQYDFSMYLDDKLEFNPNLLRDFENLLGIKNSAIAVREHYFLKPTILHEYGEAMKHKRYFALRDQTAEYIINKVKSGLSMAPPKIYWTSAIFRNQRHPDINKLNEEWYNDILLCGINCQISFDFIAQKYDVAPMPEKID